MMNILPYKGSIYGLAGIALERKREKEQYEKDRLERLRKVREGRNFTLQGIFEDICDVFELPYDEAKISSHKTEIARARHIYCYLGKKFTDHSLRQVGLLIGVDHTSVLYGKKKIIGFLKVVDPVFLPYWRYYIHNSKLFTPEDFI